MIPIRTERLILRNWEDRDRDLFQRINSDDAVMAFFPFRRDRRQSDELLDRLQGGIATNGFGFAAIEITETGDCAGFAGLSVTGELPTVAAGSIEIGWRLAPEFWRRGIAAEAASAWIEYGFSELGLDEIVSFAVSTNHRSTAVMERIGMRRDPAGDFDHSNVPDTHPQLKRHVLYRLGRKDWAMQRKGGHTAA